ncbi:hypothetical protein JNUCC1_00939 [Lentibacillus sp. JNUCC-1]|uniref:hypothetical protein n=1 Tax=Lentibacillus sp. JNUCC-1 TaxID=2654513 RepID=UPI0012E89F2D|nr:hypothetical protein [Lentibacillus sp. JNUCC-1]MUV37133.1 hypothetical protein [Lentibacillus sp. JNUCC-1]
MNYIKELNAFHTQIIFTPLSSSAVALWYALMHFNNISGWRKEFTVAASQLQSHSGLKTTSFKRAREELVTKGISSSHLKAPTGRPNTAWYRSSRRLQT